MRRTRPLVSGLFPAALLLLTCLPQGYAGEWSGVRQGTPIRQPAVNLPASVRQSVELDLTLSDDSNYQDVVVRWTLRWANKHTQPDVATGLPTGPDAALRLPFDRPAYGAPPFEVPDYPIWQSPNPLDLLTYEDNGSLPLAATGDYSANSMQRSFQTTGQATVVWYPDAGLARPMLSILVERDQSPAVVHLHAPAGWHLASVLPFKELEAGLWQLTWAGHEIERQLLFLTLPEPNAAWTVLFEVGWWLLLFGAGTIGLFLERKNRTWLGFWFVLPICMFCVGTSHAWATVAFHKVLRDLVSGPLISGWPSSRSPSIHSSAWFIYDIPSGCGAFYLGACLSWFRHQWRGRARVPPK